MQKKFKYSYAICDQADDEIFRKQCIALENHIPNLIKERLLEDVDGSLYQEYHHEKGELIVCSEIPVGAVYIDSDFDINPYFK